MCQEFCPRQGRCVSQHTLGQRPPLSSAYWDTHTPPQADTPLQADPPWADTHPLGRHPQADTHTPAATAADGTHPTGMHFCNFQMLAC